LVNLNSNLIICDDTTNIHSGQGPNSYNGLRGWM
jgi:hypothetical protein